MEHEFALKPRTLTTEGIIRNGEVGVVESPGPTCAYIPNSAVTGNQFRLLNTSDHTVEVRVQDDAFPLELVDADPTDTIDVPIGSMFFAVAGWSKVHNQFQLFATVTRATSDDGSAPQPGGPWMPVNNPAFTGNMTGDAITLKHPMGDSQLALTYSNVSGGNLDTVIVDSKLTSLTAQDMVLRAQAGENGPGTIVMRAESSIEMSAAGWRLDNGPRTDLIAAMTPYEIVFGDPNTGAADNPIFAVYGNAQFARNPKVATVVPAAQLESGSLVCRDQVFDVLNSAYGAVSLEQDRIDGSDKVKGTISLPVDTFRLNPPPAGKPNQFMFKLMVHPGRSVTIEKGSAGSETINVFGNGTWMEVASTKIDGYRIVTISRVARATGGGYEWYVHTEG